MHNNKLYIVTFVATHKSEGTKIRGKALVATMISPQSRATFQLNVKLMLEERYDLSGLYGIEVTKVKECDSDIYILYLEPARGGKK